MRPVGTHEPYGPYKDIMPYHSLRVSEVGESPNQKINERGGKGRLLEIYSAKERERSGLEQVHMALEQVH